MNAAQIREIVQQTIRQELAAFFAVQVDNSNLKQTQLVAEPGSFLARRQEALDDLERRRKRKAGHGRI